LETTSASFWLFATVAETVAIALRASDYENTLVWVIATDIDSGRPANPMFRETLSPPPIRC
jgi:hypothetical protein